MRPRRARRLIAVFAFWLSSSAAVTANDLQLTVSVDVSAADRVTITATVVNAGTAAAFDPYVELWNQPERRRTGDLPPGARAEVAWHVGADTWRQSLRQIAAGRVRYRDAQEHWRDIVVVAGLPSPADVDVPQWPEPATFTVRWPDAPAPAGRIVWWRPFALGIEAPDGWTSTGGALAIDGRVSPNSAITGSSWTAYALVLPHSADAGTIVEVKVDSRDRGRLWRPRWTWVGAWLVVCGAAWVASSRRIESLPALVVTGALGALGFALIDPSLLALSTTPAGGDYASHFVGLAYLREHLVPSGRAFGWYPDQFGGFPLLLFYFPLPFLAASLVSTVVPLPAAMKAVSLVGIVALPAAWWLSLAWLGAPRAARWIGASASAVLLFGEWQSIWGGNIGSTAAGEFAYSIGFALAWLTVARAWRTRDDARMSRGLAVLFALTAMTHGYALVAAVVGAVIVVVHPRHGPTRALRLALVGAVAFGLAAWWLMPFLWNLPWTVGVRGRWSIAIGELFPPALWPVSLLVLAGACRSLVAAMRGRVESGWFFLLVFCAAMFGLYAVGFSVGVVDVRFLPFFQGGLLLAASWEAGHWVGKLTGRTAPLATAGLAVAAIVGGAAPVASVPDWIRWNFNGIERTGPWPFYRDVMRELAADTTGLRVVFEHHPDLADAGTTRVFEMLPLFSRRPTLEGLYRESALLSPAAYYVQSLLTRTPSCPIEGLECGRFDPAEATRHLHLFAVDSIVAFGDSTARALEASSEVEARANIGPYAVFRVRQPGSLAEAVRFRPVVDESDDWRGDAYDWFRAGTDLAVPMILRRPARPDELRVPRYRPRALPREAFPDEASVTAAIDGDRITLDTSRPGRPVLIKVAYHPGWRAADGSPIDMAAPGMLLVTPRSQRTVLVWSAGTAGIAGVAASLVAVVALLCLPLLPIANRATTGGRLGWAWCAVVVGAVAASVGVALVRHPPVDYADLLAAGQRAMSARDFAAADVFFSRVLAADDRHHALRDDAGLYFALSADSAGNRAETEARLRRFLDEFPVSSFASEVLVRLAGVLEPDRADEAARLLAEAADAPLAEERWRTEARRQLQEMSQ